MAGEHQRQRDRYQAGQQQGNRGQFQVYRGVHQYSAGPAWGCRRLRCDQSFFLQVLRCYLCGLQLCGGHPAIQFAHLRFIDAVRQSLQYRRHCRRQHRARQQHRVVAREERLIILQQAQVVSIELTVGGVGISDIQVATGNGSIGQCVFQATCYLGQVIGLAQGWPAVCAVEEFQRKSDGEVRVRGKVADTIDIAPLGDFPIDGNRVTVIEAQRHVQAEATR